MRFEVQHLKVKQTHQHLRYLLGGQGDHLSANSRLNVCYGAATLDICLRRLLFLSLSDYQHRWSFSELGTLQDLERQRKGEKNTTFGKGVNEFSDLAFQVKPH